MIALNFLSPGIKKSVYKHTILEMSQTLAISITLFSSISKCGYKKRGIKVSLIVFMTIFMIGQLLAHLIVLVSILLKLSKIFKTFNNWV